MQVFSVFFELLDWSILIFKRGDRKGTGGTSQRFIMTFQQLLQRPEVRIPKSLFVRIDHLLFPSEPNLPVATPKLFRQLFF